MICLSRNYEVFYDHSAQTTIHHRLPLEEFVLVEQILEQRLADSNVNEKITSIEQAANDPQFLADLHATMDDFAEVDAEWWELPLSA